MQPAPMQSPPTVPIDPTTWYEFVIASGLCVMMVVFSVVLFYEIHYRGWRWLDRFLHRPRYSIIIGVLLTFLCHTICVWAYGLLYYALVRYGEFGSLHGAMHPQDVFAYIYFSAATYSSLGFGDVYAIGPLRLMVGVEAINGLLLIGWSVTFTYFGMGQRLK